MNWESEEGQRLDWKLIASYRRLQMEKEVELTTEEIQQIAYLALEQHHEATALLDILIPSEPHIEDLLPLLDKALLELGVDLPSRCDAVAEYGSDQIRRIERGELPPFATINDLWWIASEPDDPRLAWVLKLLNWSDHEEEKGLSKAVLDGNTLLAIQRFRASVPRSEL